VAPKRGKKKAAKRSAPAQLAAKVRRLEARLARLEAAGPGPAGIVRAGSVEVTGIVRCETLIAQNVVAASYTPGAGNVM